MPNAQIHTVYKTSDNQRVPSVTTYLGVLAKPALIHWAWQLGVQGLDYRKVKESAADTGTLVHYMILCDLKGQEPELEDYSPNDLATTVASMEKYRAWKAEHELEPVLLETPLVSEVFRFGGTPDFYGRYDGKLTLLDFKTSGDVYLENFCQLAAYGVLLVEDKGRILNGDWEFHDSFPVEAARIIRLSKVIDEGFDDRPAGNLGNHWKIFLAAQQIYELQKLVRRMKE